MIPKSFFDTINKNNIDNNKINDKFSTENIIYSNELVNDIKLLKKCNSLESLDNYINNRNNDMKLIDTLIDKENYKIKSIISLESLNIFSLEDNSNIFINIIKWIEDKINKFISWVLGLIKRLVMFFKGGKLQYTIKEVVEKFDVKKFKYLDTKITVRKLKTNITSAFAKLLLPISYLIKSYIEVKDLKITDYNNIISGNLFTDDEFYNDREFKEEYIAIGEEDNGFSFTDDFCYSYYLYFHKATHKVTITVREYFDNIYKENQNPIEVFNVLKKAPTNDKIDIGNLQNIVKNAQKSATSMKNQLKNIRENVTTEMDKIKNKSTFMQEHFGNKNWKAGRDMKENIDKVIRLLNSKLKFLTHILQNQFAIYNVRNEILKDLCKALLAGQDLLNKDTQINND